MTAHTPFMPAPCATLGRVRRVDLSYGEPMDIACSGVVGDAAPKAGCRACAMSLGAHWGRLSSDDLAVIDAARVTREFRPGETIFHEGAPCAGLYCIEDGLVCTRKMDSAGNAILLRLNHAGDLLGHCAVLAGAEYRVTAEALEPTRACFIDTATVRALLGRSPGLALTLLQRLAADLDDAEEQVLRVTTLPVRARVAHLLLVLKERYGETGASGGF